MNQEYIRLKLGDNSNLEDLGSTSEPIIWLKIDEDSSSKVGLEEGTKICVLE